MTPAVSPGTLILASASAQFSRGRTTARAALSSRALWLTLKPPSTRWSTLRIATVWGPTLTLIDPSGNLTGNTMIATTVSPV